MKWLSMRTLLFVLVSATIGQQRPSMSAEPSNGKAGWQVSFIDYMLDGGTLVFKLQSDADRVVYLAAVHPNSYVRRAASANIRDDERLFLISRDNRFSDRRFFVARSQMAEQVVGRLNMRSGDGEEQGLVATLKKVLTGTHVIVQWGEEGRAAATSSMPETLLRAQE